MKPTTGIVAAALLLAPLAALITNTGFAADAARGTHPETKRLPTAFPARLIAGATHVTVWHETGRCLGWPANGGIWSWGNEILASPSSITRRGAAGPTRSRCG